MSVGDKLQQDYNGQQTANTVNPTAIGKKPSKSIAHHLSSSQPTSYSTSISLPSMPPMPTPRTANFAAATPTTTTVNNSSSMSDPLIDRTPCGSASLTPHSDVSYETPPHVRWSHDFYHLIYDEKGADLFMKFLVQSGGGLENLLKFWYACEGLKQIAPEDREKIKKVVGAIYKRFIKYANTIPLSDNVRETLKKDLLSEPTADHDLDPRYNQQVFNAAQQEVEEQLKSDIYLNFFQSDTYIEYIASISDDQPMGAVGGTAEVAASDYTVNITNIDETHSSNNIDSMSFVSMESSLEDYSSHSEFGDYKTLPTVFEDSEFQTSAKSGDASNNSADRSHISHKFNMFMDGRPTRVSPNILNRRLKNLKAQRNTSGGLHLPKVINEPHPIGNNNVRRLGMQSYMRSKAMPTPPNPYHVTYAPHLPPSAQDTSTNVSTSSHSTNNSMSLTNGPQLEGSRENRNIRNKKIGQSNLEIQQIQQNAKLNTINGQIKNNFLLHQPRTMRPMDGSHRIQPSNVDEFAKVLMIKLEAVRTKMEKLDTNDKSLKEKLIVLCEQQTANNNTNVTEVAVCKPNIRDLIKEKPFAPEEDNDDILGKHIALTIDTPTETPESIVRCRLSPPKSYGNHGFHPKSSFDHNPGTVPTTKSMPSIQSMPPPPTTMSRVSYGKQPTVVIIVKYSTEPMPYRLPVAGTSVTFRQFKRTIPYKAGNWQYYFKRKCDSKEIIELSTPFVLEKITEDNIILPQIDGKVYAEIQESS
ncbi:axin-1-like [Oppia nitens]|uniref:axin-1-like n=1 Tax=Oppia nitens TaxID=1686743 RepID=UPI0023D9C10C|nr:axin-1-like [Oppia nitens]